MGSEMGVAVQKVVHIFGLINTVSTSVFVEETNVNPLTRFACVFPPGTLIRELGYLLKAISGM